MEYITDVDDANAKSIFKDFEIKILGEYHDLYQSRIKSIYC